MKNLDLNGFGVLEMNVVEIENLNGGNAILWFIAGIIASECLDRNASNDFNAGVSAAKSFWN